MDVVAVRKALDADCIVTGGFSLGRRALADIEAAMPGILAAVAG